MSEQKTKSSTWKELKDFVNSIPEEFLNEDATVVVGETSQSFVHGFTEDDMYYKPYDADDIYDGKTFKEELEAGNIEDPDSYKIQKAGIPFLTTEI